MIQHINTGNKDTRSGFGDAMIELGNTNPRVVALCADLTGSLKLEKFASTWPERFIQTGIAEANMIGIAAGLTIGGQIPFACSFANFITGRVYDQIRQSVAYSGKNVKICASHAGVTLGEDGATHQILEDIGLMKMLPGITVIVPCDYNQTRAATLAAASWQGPVYLRFGRPAVPNFTNPSETFNIGKAQLLQEGSDVTVFTTGHLVWKSLEACEQLNALGISAEVINIHTIKPLDKEAIIKSVKKTGCAVTAEEHQINGGLGDSIAQLLALTHPAPLQMVAVNDRFGQSGKPDELLVRYGLDTSHIVQAAMTALNRKKNSHQ